MRRCQLQGPNTRWLLCILLALLSLGVAAHGEKEEQQESSSLFSGLDSPAGKTVESFHRALRSGNREGVLHALADNVVIFEGGKVERSRAEYASHHLEADMRFLQQVQATQLELQVTESRELAYSYGRSRLQGSYEGKALDLESMETLVLKRVGQEWKIVQVHWSSK
ncbi:YybH family protein [Microbulbifer sediminum]|uniref:YybH family protein n=1 Tax=Microbulbifer sediminum TaxID=2904250 RepID=UPI001F45EBD5|nr:nuclear transport factor 2 family protein [Microbulbifer sediminum]